MEISSFFFGVWAGLLFPHLSLYMSTHIYTYIYKARLKNIKMYGHSLKLIKEEQSFRLSQDHRITKYKNFKRDSHLQPEDGLR